MQDVAPVARSGIVPNFISVAQPEAVAVPGALGQLPPGESAVSYRGRAAERLASGVEAQPWEQFTECPSENLRNPQRVHVDAFGNLHIRQGISIGNLLERPLVEITSACDPGVIRSPGPLLAGGPAEIVRRYVLPRQDGYADHCHLCYESGANVPTPDQMYGSRPSQSLIGKQAQAVYRAEAGAKKSESYQPVEGPVAAHASWNGQPVYSQPMESPALQFLVLIVSGCLRRAGGSGRVRERGEPCAA